MVSQSPSLRMPNVRKRQTSLRNRTKAGQDRSLHEGSLIVSATCDGSSGLDDILAVQCAAALWLAPLLNDISKEDGVAANRVDRLVPLHRSPRLRLSDARIGTKHGRSWTGCGGHHTRLERTETDVNPYAKLKSSTAVPSSSTGAGRGAGRHGGGAGCGARRERKTRRGRRRRGAACEEGAAATQKGCNSERCGSGSMSRA